MTLLSEMLEATSDFVFKLDIEGEALRLERNLERKLRGLFNKIAAEIEAQITTPGAIGSVGNPAMATQAFNKMVPQFAATIADEIEKFKTLPRNVVQLLRDNIFTASQATLERLKGDVMGVISQGVNQGIGIKPIAQNLRGVFSDMKKFELNRIARTEVKAAQGLATQGQFLDRGVQFQQWSTTMDGRERESHAIIDGEIIRVGDTFSNGLKYPGDRNGAIDEWINCRCSVVPFILPRGMIAPSKEQFREGELISMESN
jgi:SPP1 gp7 family putative phage head morphogenesis protein